MAGLSQQDHALHDRRSELMSVLGREWAMSVLDAAPLGAAHTGHALRGSHD